MFPVCSIIIKKIAVYKGLTHFHFKTESLKFDFVALKLGHFFIIMIIKNGHKNELNVFKKTMNQKTNMRSYAD